MDDVTAESAGANPLKNRAVRMSLTSAGRLRFAPLAVGGLLLLVAVTWHREFVSGAQVEPPEYRSGGIQAGSESGSEPEIEIIPRRMTAPIVDNRPPVRYRKAEPPLSQPARAVPSRSAQALRDQLPEAAASVKPDVPRRRQSADSDESAEQLVRPSPTVERAEPLVLHRTRRGGSSGPGSPHGDIAVPLILGPEDRVPEGVPGDLEEVMPGSDEPLPQEIPATAPVVEKPPLVVREEMPFWDPKFAVPAAPAPMTTSSSVPAAPAGASVQMPAAADLIHSAPVVDGGTATSSVPQWPAGSAAGAGAVQFPENTSVQQPAVQPPQWPGSSTAVPAGTTGMPGTAGYAGVPAQPYSGWPSGAAGYGYGNAPSGAAGGWQPYMPQQAPAYQLPVRPDSYRSITSGGMSAGGIGGSGRYGQLAGTGRPAGVPTPPGARYGSLPAAQSTVQAPPPAVSRYGSGVSAGGRTGMGYAARPTVPQQPSQYAQMRVPQFSGMPQQSQSRYGASPAMGAMVNSARPYSAAQMQQMQMQMQMQQMQQMQQAAGVPAGRVPGVSTAGRSQALPSGAVGGGGVPVRAAPASSSRYGVPAGSVPGTVRR